MLFHLNSLSRYCLIFVISLLLILSIQLSNFANINLLKQAQHLFHQAQYQQVIEILSSFQSSSDPIIHEYLATSYERTGQLGLALSHWDKAQQIYQEHHELDKAGKLQLWSAQLLVEFGQPLKAIAVVKDSAFGNTSVAQGILGNAYLVAGEESQAIDTFEKFLSQRNLSENQQLATLNNLNRAYHRQSLKLRQEAQFLRQENEHSQADLVEQQALALETSARETANNAWTLVQKKNNLSPELIRAWLNWLPYVSPSEQRDYIDTIQSYLYHLPLTHQTINLWLSLRKFSANPKPLLEKTLQLAQNLGDQLGLSLVEGELGNFYETQNNYALALEYTQKAQKVANSQLDYQQLYRWQWQEGRIYQALGDEKAALSAYRRAIVSLQRIRRQIAAASRDVQFDFQQEIEPIYRGLLSLLLQHPSPDTLEEAIEIFEQLEIAQIENIFQDTCFGELSNFSSQKRLKQEKVAIIAPVILREKLHLILRLPNGSYHYHSQPIDINTFNKKIEKWKNELLEITENQYLNSSSYFYDLILSPFESSLEATQPTALVFLNDGLLKNVPMSALYDKKHQQFIIQKYPITSAISLQLLTQKIANKDISLKLLSFGLSLARPPVDVALPNVSQELQQIQNLLGGQKFLNEKFTIEQLRRELSSNNPNILHLATHGKFTGSTHSSFVQAYDQIISLDKLDDLLSNGNNLDLLTLSACDTSVGNSRSVLGLAGVAARAGVGAVMGSLWQVQDNTSVQIIEDFYRNLKSGMSNPKALQVAQLKEIENNLLQHPRNWAAFTLIGL